MPPPKPVQSVRLNNNTLYQTVDGIETARGNVVGISPDANGNIVIGLGVQLDGRSTNNFVTADNVQIKNSHNNILNAKNLIIEDSSGINANGADHTVKKSPYCEVGNDANWVENAESSRTKGTGNKNYVHSGSINGNNNRLGKPDVQFYNSSIEGDNDIVEGNGSKAIGNYIKVVGDNIIVIGNGSPNNLLFFNTPGTHIVP